MRTTCVARQVAWCCVAAVAAGIVPVARGMDLGSGAFTYSVWMRTRCPEVVLFSTSPPAEPRAEQVKGLYCRHGGIVFDVIGGGALEARGLRFNDDRWHHVVLTSDPVARRQAIWFDGRVVAEGGVRLERDPAGSVLKLGGGPEDHVEWSYSFGGTMRDIRWYDRVLTAGQVAEVARGKPLAGGLVPRLRLGLEGDPAELRRLRLPEGAVSSEDTGGAGVAFDGWGSLVVNAEGRGAVWVGRPWRFGSGMEREWEKADGLWDCEARTPGELARAFAAAAARRCPGMAEAARGAAGEATEIRRVAEVRRIYHEACRWHEARLAVYAEAPAVLDRLGRRLAAMVRDSGERFAADSCRQVLESLAARRRGWTKAPPLEELEAWTKEFEDFQQKLARQELLLRGIDKLVFIRRFTYNANHYYTEYINSAWRPGGGLCVLDLRTGAVTPLAAELGEGVCERFDISFDAKRVVFSWKAAPDSGYRLHEVNIDGSGLRQVLGPPADEAELVAAYRKGYHHGTDDMSPCYLPDGGICFVSTRCQHGTLCDSPDDFTTTVLYRVDSDGRNLRKLTNSALSESSPSMLEDGRILYTRWEYVDKGAVSVKCLWSMRPDGTGSAEVFGGDIALPPTLIFGRGIPGQPNHCVVLGTPHYPQNAVGTVIRLDLSQDIRGREPMTYMTPQVDIRAEGGFSFRRADGGWVNDGAGRGPLFRDPWPLAMDRFLVAHKPEGEPANHPTAWGLYLLDETGEAQLLLRDPAISCWMPVPLRARVVPPRLSSTPDPALAAAGQARCVVTDVYQGLEGVGLGTIRHLRVLEQVPRPWSARRPDDADLFDQQHACITMKTHLGLKVQHGIVPVEEDGSANFLVPAGANIFLQALDENHMAVQTERTYVNYMPGESRSCIGCHERPSESPGLRGGAVPLALRRAPSLPGAQPGESDGKRALDYAQDVQPVWDRHCLECHSGRRKEGGLDLGGEMTTLFNVSYEALLARSDLLGKVIGENHPKTGNVEYLPAGSLGSRASVLAAMLADGKVELADPRQAARVAKLRDSHREVRLRPEELLKVTNWLDTNCQYYGSWWGRRNLRFKGQSDFRPLQTFRMARSPVPPPGMEQAGLSAGEVELLRRGGGRVAR